MYITDNYLTIVMAPVPAVLAPVVITTPVWGIIIQHHFVTPVQIIVPVDPWQRCGEDPAASVKINELPAWHVIVHIYIRQIIIGGIIITRRTPLWLYAQVYLNTNLGLAGLCKLYQTKNGDG